MSVVQFTPSVAAAVLVPASATPGAATPMPGFTGQAQQVRVTNPGTVHAHLAFGDSTVVASNTSPYIVDPGGSAIFSVPRSTHVSAFVSTGTPNVHVVLGHGE